MDSSHNHSFIVFTCRAGKLEVVKYLIDIHCNKECTDNDGMTPLHVAAR